MVRVVVTGLGCLSPFGEGVSALWKGLLSNKSALKYEQELRHVVGKVDDNWEAFKSFSKGEKRELGKIGQMSLIAAKEAMEDAGAIDMDHTETMVNIGTGVMDLELVADTGEMARNGKARMVSPYFVPRILANIPGAHVAMKYGFRGGVECTSTACATGVHCIGQVAERIRRGTVRRGLAGAADASVTPLGVLGFDRMRALAQGENALSCPFDVRRGGFVMSEGIGLLFLEREDDAKKRGAKIYAEVAGFGISSDTVHVSSPPADGSGLFLAMERALRDAHVDPREVAYVNAHATSTKIGDASEATAIGRLFAHQPPVSSNKGHIGHLLAGAGAVETIATVMAIREGRIPPTLHLGDTDCHIQHVRENTDLRQDMICVKNSLGFGGSNGVLVLRSRS